MGHPNLFNKYGNVIQDSPTATFCQEIERSVEAHVSRLVKEGATVTELRALSNDICSGINVSFICPIMRKQLRDRQIEREAANVQDWVI